MQSKVVLRSSASALALSATATVRTLSEVRS
jgi:hypothetical protein